MDAITITIKDVAISDAVFLSIMLEKSRQTLEEGFGPFANNLFDAMDIAKADMINKVGFAQYHEIYFSTIFSIENVFENLPPGTIPGL
ncbi:MAG TPA: hypothetical protein VF581_07870 [Flavobacterium sp.]|jgi:hypothetical protein